LDARAILELQWEKNMGTWAFTAVLNHVNNQP